MFTYSFVSGLTDVYQEVLVAGDLFWFRATDANLEVLVAGDFFCFRATNAY